MPRPVDPLPRLRQFAMPLYQQGMSDRRIQKELRCARKFVRQWRQENGLPTAPRGKHRRLLDEIGLELYERGWPDWKIAAEIAKRNGGVCDESTVERWRKSRGIPANCKAGSEDWYILNRPGAIEKRAEVMRLVEIGCTDKEAAEIMQVTVNAFECLRRKMGLKANKPRDGRRYRTVRRPRE